VGTFVPIALQLPPKDTIKFYTAWQYLLIVIRENVIHQIKQIILFCWFKRGVVFFELSN